MFRTALKILEEKWKSYRHRFVPWIALNLWKNERTLRQVPKLSQDKLVPDEEVTDSLLRFFRALFRNDLVNQVDILSQLPISAQTHYLGQEDHGKETADNTGTDGPKRGFDLMFHNLGFCLERQPSTLPFGGTGVFVTKGLVPKGVTVAMYPGTVYQSYDPIFFQSIRNPFVFRCIDSVLVDGNDKGISKMVYRSCSGRDRLGPLTLSDTTWLTDNPVNPLAVGQYVNNCTNERTANVCYQEYDVLDGFPVELRQYLPNVNYAHDSQRPLRCVVLVSLQNIHPGEELFSNYYTIVH